MKTQQPHVVLASVFAAAVILSATAASRVSATQASPATFMTADELSVLKRCASIRTTKPVTLDSEVKTLFRLVPEAAIAYGTELSSKTSAGGYEEFIITFVRDSDDVVITGFRPQSGDAFLTNSSRTLKGILLLDPTGTYLAKEDSQTWKEAANRYPTVLTKWAEISRKISDPKCR